MRLKLRQQSRWRKPCGRLWRGNENKDSRVQGKKKKVKNRIMRSHLKKRTLVQGQGGRYIRTGGILQYLEDLNLTPNAEIGPKDFFEIASSKIKSRRKKIAFRPGFHKDIDQTGARGLLIHLSGCQFQALILARNLFFYDGDSRHHLTPRPLESSNPEF
jgi:hypothetical protein